MISYITQSVLNYIQHAYIDSLGEFLELTSFPLQLSVLKAIPPACLFERIEHQITLYVVIFLRLFLRVKLPFRVLLSVGPLVRRSVFYNFFSFTSMLLSEHLFFCILSMFES